jgi:hypothetical protein
MKLVKRINHVSYSQDELYVAHTDKVQNAKQIVDTYHDVFDGIGKISGMYELKIDPQAQPVAHPPRPIPASLREPTLKKLEELQRMKIIERVPVGQPTPWCSALHVVRKKSMDPEEKEVDVRITIDPQDLNRVLLREYHPMSTIEDVTTRTENSKYFSVLDARMGYFQLELTPESQNLTAFNTPFWQIQVSSLADGNLNCPGTLSKSDDTNPGRNKRSGSHNGRHPDPFTYH